MCLLPFNLVCIKALLTCTSITYVSLQHKYLNIRRVGLGWRIKVSVGNVWLDMTGLKLSFVSEKTIFCLLKELKCKPCG